MLSNSIVLNFEWAKCLNILHCHLIHWMTGGKTSHSVIRLTPPLLPYEWIIWKKKDDEIEICSPFHNFKMQWARANGKSDKLYNFKLFNISAVKALFHFFIHLSIDASFFLWIWPSFPLFCSSIAFYSFVRSNALAVKMSACLLWPLCMLHMCRYTCVHEPTDTKYESKGEKKIHK